MDRAPLARLLDRYQTSDDTEATHLARMKELLKVEGDPFSRNHFVPGHFTASAFVVSPDLDQVLLIFHGKLHRWLQPGGHVDPTDVDIVTAARREVSEEVGLSELDFAFGPQILDVDVHVIPERKGDPEHEHFDVRFAFRAPSLDYTVGSDARDGRWVPFDQVTEAESDASVMRALARIQDLAR